ncbi:hypothetical protein KP509_01G021600 [Ceratopteris richardii]|uniref:RING-type domain-containing protein n=1 Tax=Ceratopteris richardii TaxID=49495 RepID=A0A8T2VET2_CERRI|nr:hypothetical protein KP509_01G021600 [Ceratopteris richardii]
MGSKLEDAAIRKSVIGALPVVYIEEKDECVNCAICISTIIAGSPALQLPCKHLFHSECIARWLRAKNTCPLCRCNLETEES